MTDRKYLLENQYRTAANLNARIGLHERFSANKYGWFRWVFDQFDIPPTARILEVGCGTGALWVDNRDRIPAGWEITVSDYSAGMLDEAAPNLRAVGLSLHHMVLDTQNIPVSDANMDTVIANHMLYHVPDRSIALSEMRRVLRSSGRLYATTNGLNHMRELDELLHRVGLTRSAAHSPFNLENGAEELSAWFPNVELRRYDDALRVTDAGPLVSYILSIPGASSLSKSQLAELRRFLEGELARHGAFYITKSSGMFTASRA